MADFRYARGSTIQIFANILAGDPTGWSATASLRRKPAGAFDTIGVDISDDILTGSEPVAASFVVLLEAATLTSPLRWSLVIDAATSLALPAGLYLGDLRPTLAAYAEVTRFFEIELYTPATRP